MSGQSPQEEIGNFLLGGGEMGARMRSHDWSQTKLGSVDTWQQSLKTAVRIMLTSRQPMFVWWGDHLINLYNDAYKAILGGKHPQVLGQPASDVWQEIWEQVGPRAESALIKNEATYDEALLLIMERNGYPEETYYTFSYSPVPNDYGGTGGIICANTDDTQRIIGERQLALLRELAARTVDARTFEQACSLSLGCLETNPYDLPWAMIYLVDPDQQNIVLSGTCGIDPNHEAVPEIVDFNADSVWHLAEVIKTNKSYVISNLDTTYNNLPTGAWQRSPHQAVAVPIAASGQTGKSGILVVGLNPFRLFDDKYQGFIDLVASQIAASIANAQAYEEERKRAEALAELDRAKTVFFSNVSHEFRTPLTLMLGPLEDTLTNCATLLPPREREQLEMVQRNAYRLLKLVNTLLDFSRIEAGRVQASYEPTDLATFTSELASVFRSAIERAGMQLSVNCPPQPEPVYVDREMWEKIVLNLLSNAFKFTFTGEIAVSLKLSNDHVELIVKDTGIGIPAAEIPHMFERFHRVKGAQGRTFEGSGIGLSLVQELVQIHGGTIQVTSVEGEGSCFTVSIPRGSAHLPQDRINSDRTLASTALGAIPYLEEALRWLPEETGGQGSRGAGEQESLIFPSPSLLFPPSSARILIADDNTDMRDYVTRLLSQQYEVEALPDGLAALSAARQRMPDLVLTDVMMPGLDGFGLLRELRNDPQMRKVPIILLSARAGEEARVEGLEAGADDYLIKPFSARELLARVEAALKMAHLRQEAMQREQGLRIEAEVAKAHLETVLSGIQDQFYVLDQEWRYSFVNDRVAETVGCSKEDLLGKRIWELFPDLSSTLFSQEVRRAVKEQTVVRFEYFYSHWQRWFENRVYPFAEGVTIFVTDISDRKQAEKALRESEERFRNMADNAPFMVWVTDPTGYCTYLSKSWYEFSGQTEATGLGFGWLDAVHLEDREDAKKTFLTANDCGDAYRVEFRLRRKDGEYRWVIDAANPWFGIDGQFKGFIGSVIDISERKQAEAERDRLLQLEQAAREEAETANRVKDEFLAVLSHELRSPLNPILGWTKLLQSRKFDEQFTKRALETIERNAKLQTELIEDLLDVSRILRGKMALNIAPVNLVTTIQSAIETVRLSAEAKQIQIQTLFTAHVGQVMGDSVRLQQIVWNLLSNAIKFTPSGGKVEICLEQVGMNIQMQVKDTGKGINPEFLPYVFEYFRQEDGKTTRKFGGLGLGLAIVRYLTELHGGTVQAESLGEEMGATFTVTLPLLKQENVEIINNQVPLSLTLDTSPLAGVKILVVDDEPDMRELMLTILESSGAEVRISASAAEALAEIDSFNPNMLISDIGMPEMDGYMLMRQVRQRYLQAGGNVIAIALTAYAGELDQQQALAAGFQRHIAKPIDPVELVQIISNMLKQA
ncbi:MAG TPA: ATP-binding protein [Oculatellaceae cyanobacterium]|jgi:PAS domain S-box-containing protein